MISLAITGSFSSGKTFILKYLESIGYKVFSCDEYIRNLYIKKEVQDKILQEIPELKIFDKNKLAKIVYNDTAIKKKLEKIIHPLVLEGIISFKQDHLKEKYIFAEVPLLFETGFDKYFDYSICIYCSEVARYERAKLRENFNIVLFEKIINSQLPQEVKMEKADFNINSECDLIELAASINKIIRNI